MRKHDTNADFIAAFWKLYEKKRIEKISIREICQLAGYNRTTFYAHYQNIYDLLGKAALNIVFDSHLLEKLFLKIFQQEDRYIELLFRNQHDYILAEKIKTELISLMKEKCVASNIDFQNLQYLLEYQISAVLGIIRYWFQTDKKSAEHELIEMIYHISTQGVLTIVRKKLLKVPLLNHKKPDILSGFFYGYGIRYHDKWKQFDILQGFGGVE